MFVMTAYVVAMTHQTKTITDAATDAGVGVAQGGRMNAKGGVPRSSFLTKRLLT